MHFRLLTLSCVPLLLAHAAFAQAQTQTEPGEEWQTSAQMQMPGFAMPAQSSTVCMPQGSTEPPPGPDTNCQMYDVERLGTTTKWKMRCTGEQAMTGTGEMTWQGRDSYSGKMVMNMDGQTVTTKLTGKRTGAACDAGKIRKQVAQAQAQSDRMIAQQCAEAARGMNVAMFDGTSPMNCDPRYKKDFCTRAGTEEGYDLLATSGAAALQSASRTCGVDAEVSRSKLCADAQKKQSLAFFGRHCPSEAAPLAKEQCAGRSFTNRPPQKYVEFCDAWARHALTDSSDAGAASGSDAGTPPASGPDQGAGPEQKDTTVEKGKKALKKLLPF